MAAGLTGLIGRRVHHVHSLSHLAAGRVQILRLLLVAALAMVFQVWINIVPLTTIVLVSSVQCLYERKKYYTVSRTSEYMEDMKT